MAVMRTAKVVSGEAFPPPFPVQVPQVSPYSKGPMPSKPMLPADLGFCPVAVAKWERLLYDTLGFAAKLKAKEYGSPTPVKTILFPLLSVNVRSTTPRLTSEIETVPKLLCAATV